jgi:hypothetical protein
LYADEKTFIPKLLLGSGATALGLAEAITEPSAVAPDARGY